MREYPYYTQWSQMDVHHTSCVWCGTESTGFIATESNSIARWPSVCVTCYDAVGPTAILLDQLVDAHARS